MTFHAPQIIWLILVIIGLFAAAVKDGEKYERRCSFSGSLLCTILAAGLLYWGGFFG